jgi:hypothetical protein
MGVVECATCIGEERAVADCVVVAALCVAKQGGRANGRVACAGSVEQQRYCANCGIVITRVEEQRSSANTGVEVAVAD